MRIDYLLMRLAFLTVTAAFVLGVGCASGLSENPAPRPRSYLALPVDALGGLPSVPYVWEGTSGAKTLAVIGTLHTRDPEAPMYDAIEAVFERIRPSLVLHESSMHAPPDTSRTRSIERGGGIGFAAHLAARYGAELRSGDASEAAEFAALLGQYPAEAVLVFLTGQRLIGGYDPDSAAVAGAYADFYAGYLAANGIPVRDGWDAWPKFLRAYERVLGEPFTPASWDPDVASPIRDVGPLNEIARTANAVRDRHLLAAIRDGLEDHDRVVVVFGGWHVLALDPVLHGVLETAGRPGR